MGVRISGELQAIEDIGTAHESPIKARMSYGRKQGKCQAHHRLRKTFALCLADAVIPHCRQPVLSSCRRAFEYQRDLMRHRMVVLQSRPVTMRRVVLQATSLQQRRRTAGHLSHMGDSANPESQGWQHYRVTDQ